MNDVIFRTVHGSHLYGLAHEHSDRDTFTVTTSLRFRARQRVIQSPSVRGPVQDDQVDIGLNRFLHNALRGSHQSVEALFSPYKQWNPEQLHWKPYLEGLVICGSEVFERYERTIVSFSFGEFKKRRHAARLALNLRGLRRDGRFDPALSSTQAAHITALAHDLADEALVRALIPGWQPAR